MVGRENGKRGKQELGVEEREGSRGWDWRNGREAGTGSGGTGEGEGRRVGTGSGGTGGKQGLGVEGREGSRNWEWRNGRRRGRGESRDWECRNGREARTGSVGTEGLKSVYAALNQPVRPYVFVTWDGFPPFLHFDVRLKEYGFSEDTKGTLFVCKMRLRTILLEIPV